MKKYLGTILPIIFFAITASLFVVVVSQRDEAIKSSQESFVASQLVEHVANFFDDAEAHGIKLNRRGLTVILHEFDSAEVLGCSYGEKTVWINKSYVLIDISDRTEENFLKLEQLVYHELGHALLGKDHDYGLSIMNCCSQSTEAYVRSPEYRKFMIEKIFLPTTRRAVFPKPFYCYMYYKTDGCSLTSNEE